MRVCPRITLAAGLLAFLPSAQPLARMPDAAPAFVEHIASNDNRVPAGRLHNGVLTLRLELRTGMFRPHGNDGPGVEVLAFGEGAGRSRFPGPLVRVPEGTIIAATIRNRLADSTLVLHGFTTRPGPADDTIQVRPGATRSVRFTAGRAGTYYYWGTTTGKAMEDDRWIDSQLSGGFIVDSAGTTPPPAERVFVMGLWLKPADNEAGEPEREFMVINGKSWPETERLEYTVGDTVRWRWLNPTSSSHPMHLHGFYYEVESRGSWARRHSLRRRDHRLVVTELMPPGGTMTARWTPTRPGNWLFHCHFAFHIRTSSTVAAPDTERALRRATCPTEWPAWCSACTCPRPWRHGDNRIAASSRQSPSRRGSGCWCRPVRDPPDSAHLMGYVLQEGDREPAPDSTVIPGPHAGARARPAGADHGGEPARRGDGGALARDRAGELADGVPGWSGRRRDLPADRAGRFVHRGVHAAPRGDVHLSLPRERADRDLGRALRPADRRRARDDVRHGDEPPGDRGRAVPARQLVRRGERAPRSGADRAQGGPHLSLPAHQHRRRADLVRTAPRPDGLFRRRLASGGQGRRRPARVSGGGQHRHRSPPVPGETADFEYRAGGARELVLDVDAPFAAWRLEVPVHITR